MRSAILASIFLLLPSFAPTLALPHQRRFNPDPPPAPAAAASETLAETAGGQEATVPSMRTSDQAPNALEAPLLADVATTSRHGPVEAPKPTKSDAEGMPSSAGDLESQVMSSKDYRELADQKAKFERQQNTKLAKFEQKQTKDFREFLTAQANADVELDLATFNSLFNDLKNAQAGAREDFLRRQRMNKHVFLGYFEHEVERLKKTLAEGRRDPGA